MSQLLAFFFFLQYNISYKLFVGEYMSSIFKTACKVWGKLIVIILLCNFICLTTQVLSTSLFCETVGYSVYGYEGDNEDDLRFLYEHYYKDGEDKQIENYNNSDYTLQRRSIREEMTGLGKTVFLLISQIICAIITIAFLYKPLWSLGVKDSNAVRFKHTKEDKLKGLKIGVIASIPTFLIYILFVLCSIKFAPDMPTVIYTWLNCHLFSFLDLIFTSYPTAGTLGILQYLLLFILLAVIPAFCMGCYLLGYKNIDIGEKVVYKNDKE